MAYHYWLANLWRNFYLVINMGLFQKTYTSEQWEKYKKDNPELFDPNHPDYDLDGGPTVYEENKEYFDNLFIK
jgi:hypothetical protein